MFEIVILPNRRREESAKNNILLTFDFFIDSTGSGRLMDYRCKQEKSELLTSTNLFMR